MRDVFKAGDRVVNRYTEMVGRIVKRVPDDPSNGGPMTDPQIYTVEYDSGLVQEHAMASYSNPEFMELLPV